MRHASILFCAAVLIGCMASVVSAQTDDYASAILERTSGSYPSVLGSSSSAPSASRSSATVKSPSTLKQSMTSAVKPAASYTEYEEVSPADEQHYHHGQYIPHDGSHGDCEYCEHGPAIPSAIGDPCAPCGGGWAAGVDLVFLKPRFNSDIALSTTDIINGNNTIISDSSFDYDLNLSPRLWLGWGHSDGMGWRVQWWKFSQDSSDVVGTASASGLGTVETPIFPGIDIGVDLPGETIRASSALDLWALDVEATREASFGNWSIMAAGGVRYASIDQSYEFDAYTLNGTRQGYIDLDKTLEGIGPTVFLEARRILGPRFSIFASARGSLLFGDRETTFSAGEDVDLSSATFVNRTSGSDGLIPNLETRVGVDYMVPIRCMNFFMTAALEGQWWGEVGTASDSNADLGLFGFSVGGGVQF